MNLVIETKSESIFDRRSRTVDVLLIRKDGQIKTAIVDGVEYPLEHCEWKIENGDRSNELILKFAIKGNPAILDMPMEITAHHHST